MAQIAALHTTEWVATGLLGGGDEYAVQDEPRPEAARKARS
jgi:hypothetical protein